MLLILFPFVFSPCNPSTMPLDLQFTGLLFDEPRIHIEEQTMSEVLLRYTPYDHATDSLLFSLQQSPVLSCL